MEILITLATILMTVSVIGFIFGVWAFLTHKDKK